MTRPSVGCPSRQIADGRLDFHARCGTLEKGEKPPDFGEHLLGRCVSGEDVARPRGAGGFCAVRRRQNEKRDVARDRVGAHRPDGLERASGSCSRSTMTRDGP